MRSYVITSILIILGLLAIAGKGSLPEKHWLIPYLAEISSALLVGGLLSLLFKLIQDKETESNLRRLLRIHDSVDELGLKQILPESQAYNFTSIIDESDSLSIVMNDGLRWVGNNTVALRNRFSRNTLTEFFTVDPDSRFVESLALKTSIDIEDLQKKIRETWKRIEDCYNESSKQGTLKIYKLKTYPTKSVFLTEHILVETPYQTASGRANIPVYEYCKVARSDSPYAFSVHDIEEIRKESKLAKYIIKGIEQSI